LLPVVERCLPVATSTIGIHGLSPVGLNRELISYRKSLLGAVVDRLRLIANIDVGLWKRRIQNYVERKCQYGDILIKLASEPPQSL